MYERKVKNSWIRLDHSDKFYTNIIKILNLAYELKIIDYRYTIKELKRKDGFRENHLSDIQRFT